MLATFPFGHKILCDGNVIFNGLIRLNAMFFNKFLCDGHVIKSMNLVKID